MTEEDEYQSLLGLVPKEMLDEAVENRGAMSILAQESLTLVGTILMEHDSEHLQEMEILEDLVEIWEKQNT